MIDDAEGGPGVGSAEEDWVRRMAALPLDGPPLPDAQVIWWKAMALRRFHVDARRSAAADQIQTGVACAAAIALLIYVFASGSAALLLPSLALPVASGVALLIIGVALAGSAARCSFR